jgi:hypothetical protein
LFDLGGTTNHNLGQIGDFYASVSLPSVAIQGIIYQSNGGLRELQKNKSSKIVAIQGEIIGFWEIFESWEFLPPPLLFIFRITTRKEKTRGNRLP